MDIKVTARTYKVCGGPAKDTLFDAVKYAYDNTNRVTVNFSVVFDYEAPGGTYRPLHVSNFKLIGIAHEDGSGHKFNIAGYCYVRFAPMNPEASHFHQRRFTMFYDAKKREGKITFPES
ncbi:hypothetical protein IKH79_02550 [Candidatus Saccharibacteria bacterium]|nr:hypothetical protein [Candidatus Saccharibacteria bacterium]